MDAVIRTERITKSFGRVKAVDDVSLSVRKGEIYGFLGLNGAGKSTTIRMLLGMIKPTFGKAYIKEHRIDPSKTDIFRAIGYMVEAPCAYPELTVRENLEIARRLRFMKDGSPVAEIMKRLSIEQYRNRKAKDLSSGNAQRLGLAKALMHEPEILVLDEPSNGLDPAGIVEIRELLIDLSANKGVTIFISSHILGEISRLASRIGIIHEGRLVHETDSRTLDVSRKRRLIIDAVDRGKAKARLEKEGYAVRVNDEGFMETSDRNAVAHPESIASILASDTNPPTRLVVDEEDLEDYFLRIIGKDGGVA